LNSLIRQNLIIFILAILVVTVPVQYTFNILLNNLSTAPKKSLTEAKTALKTQEITYDKYDTAEPNRGYTREVIVLSNSSTKTYMDYKLITDSTSPQWQYIYNSNEVVICEDGFIRTADMEYLGVALGSYFGNIGTKWIFTLDNGTQLKVVKIEEKADEHTCDNGFMQKWDKSVIEFVVDTDKMDYATGENGLKYNGNFNNNEWLKGEIVKIEEVIK